MCFPQRIVSFRFLYALGHRLKVTFKRLFGCAAITHETNNRSINSSIYSYLYRTCVQEAWHHLAIAMAN